MKKEEAMKIANDIMGSLDSWVNLDCLYEPSYDGEGTLYDECVEMIANFILEGVNKNGEKLEEENKKLKAELEFYKKQYEHSMGED